MRRECINAVQQAAQRTLTAREIQNIEDRIYRNMRQLARNDPASWRQMTDAERLRRAGQLAADELQQEAGLKRRRVALTIAARQRLDAFINGYRAPTGSWARLTAPLHSVLTGNRISCLSSRAERPRVITR